MTHYVVETVAPTLSQLAGCEVWTEVDVFEGRGAKGAADLHAKVKTISERKPHRVVKKDVIVLYRPRGTS